MRDNPYDFTIWSVFPHFSPATGCLVPIVVLCVRISEGGFIQFSLRDQSCLSSILGVPSRFKTFLEFSLPTFGVSTSVPSKEKRG